ncbi:aminoacetone oxidase family FAD-binding enzyme [Anaerotruncus colihominis]|uniref:Aminoacetone oxidase family FAD-binding enzyme n=1 Tax=Anaerotruncus colihominis TaxID=169435 RepID=A0A845RLT0_9FIRM|nr:aminoacetone oxidase family FAD-binding enzyme [Anaerotruncus colihominis]NBI78642.1 aminoacetone oxidase family FAD-binding enzyme [Anaerotruncus colihominis]
MKEQTTGFDVAIAGGGASGLAAAVTAAAAGARVLLLERMDRVGKKILATGNGRCNLTNLEISARHYHTSDRAVLTEMLAQMPAQKTISFFEELGLLCSAPEDGKIYPYCFQASMALDCLLAAIRRRCVRTALKFDVAAVEPRGQGFAVTAADGRCVTARCAILAGGGLAAPKLGGTGGLYQAARDLGHTVTQLYPCLVPLKCKNAFTGGLKGIRVRARGILTCAGRRLGEQTGEWLFTDYGLSGIPALQLSCLLWKPAAPYRLEIDLFPDWETQRLAAFLDARRSTCETLEEWLLGTVPKRVGYAVMKSVGLAPLSRPVAGVDAEQIAALVRALKGWTFEVTGPLSWEQAQTTGGGVPLSEIDPETCMSRRRRGLFLTGELLDAAGDCGGYNLHWAWNTGIAAGQAAARMAKSGGAR